MKGITKKKNLLYESQWDMGLSSYFCAFDGSGANVHDAEMENKYRYVPGTQYIWGHCRSIDPTARPLPSILCPVCVCDVRGQGLRSTRQNLPERKHVMAGLGTKTDEMCRHLMTHLDKVNG